MQVAVGSSIGSSRSLVVSVKGLTDVNSVCCHRSSAFRRKSLLSAITCYKVEIRTKAQQSASSDSYLSCYPTGKFVS